MSTPTAIEIVRAYLDARVKKWGTQADVDLDCALASVLRDAERFHELREAHECGGPMDIQVPDENGENWTRWVGTLAELADKLRSETK